MTCLMQDHCRFMLQRRDSLHRVPSRSLAGIRCAGSGAAISASPSARDRRRERNERREQGKLSWREEVEEKDTEKKKAVPKGLKYELDMSRLTSRGLQWWMVLVSVRAELSMAESISSILANDFPGEEFEVFVPTIPTKRKLKDGSISSATRRLHSGCVFLRCILSRKVHDAVRRIPRVKGFFGKKIGFYDYVIMPTPVPVEDIERMQKKIRDEETDFFRLKELFEEEKKLNEAVSEKDEAVSEKDISITMGSNIRVVKGPYANFEGHITDLPNENSEVQASIMEFGRVTKVVVGLDEIEILPRPA